MKKKIYWEKLNFCKNYTYFLLKKNNFVSNSFATFEQPYTSVWSLESISVFLNREAVSLHCPVKNLTCCTLGLWKRVWYSPNACCFWDCFCFFYIFDKSSSFSPQKIHSTKATVSVDDLHFSSTMFFFLRTTIARTLIFHVGLVKSCFFSSLVF